EPADRVRQRLVRARSGDHAGPPDHLGQLDRRRVRAKPRKNPGHDMTVEAPPGLALEMSGLTVRLRRGPVIVEDIDLRLARGEILGVVGESGSGKTTAALSLLGFSSDGTEISSGEFELGGEKVRTDDSLRALRGSVISYVPQDPGRALN